jgi:hypothetical protein
MFLADILQFFMDRFDKHCMTAPSVKKQQENRRKLTISYILQKKGFKPTIEV